MKRRTPLRAKKPLRRSRLPPTNPKRKEALYRRNFAGPAHWKTPHDAFVRRFFCLAHPKRTGVPGLCGTLMQSAHVIKRSAGGGYESLVPLCWKHHAEQEGRTKRFEAKYGLDLAAEAARLVAQHEAEEAGT